MSNPRWITTASGLSLLTEAPEPIKWPEVKPDPEDKRWLCDDCFDGGEEKSGPGVIFPGSKICFNCGNRCASGSRNHPEHRKYPDCHNVGFSFSRVKPEKLLNFTKEDAEIDEG